MRAAFGYLKSPVVQMSVILLLGLFVYSSTFGYPFQFDDNGNINENVRIKTLSNVPGFFTGASGPFASRPLLHATDAINYYFGGLDTRGYHAVNVSLHLINGILIYLLVSMTGRHLGLEERNWRTAAALSALIFVVHPINTEAVTYVISRSMLLAAMFFMMGLALFLKAVTSERGKVLYGAGLFAVSMLGMASRENFATFPVVLFLFDIFIVSGFRVKDALRRHYKLYVPVLLSLGYFAFIALSNTYDRGSDYPGIGIRPYDYALTQFRVHWTYLRLLALPVAQNADYDYPIAKSLLTGPTLIAFLGYVGLWLGAALKSKKKPLVSFGVLWFLITLIPISFGVTLMSLRLGDVIFEHRAYLPSAGIVTAAMWAMVFMTDRREALRKTAVAAVVVVAVVFAVAAHSRNYVWRSDVSLWSDVVAKSPEKDRGHYNLGLSYQHIGKTKNAIRQYEKASEVRPGASEPHDLGIIIKDESHYNMGNIYQEQGTVEEAIKQYETAIKINPRHAKSYNRLGMLYRKKGRIDKAIEYYRKAIEIKPGDPEFHNNLGNAYDISGEPDKAIDEYNEALRINPDYVIAYYNRAITYMGKGMEAAAIEQLQRATEVRPDYIEAHYSLAQIYLKRGDRDLARQYLLNVLRLNPNHYWARQLLNSLDSEGKP